MILLQEVAGVVLRWVQNLEMIRRFGRRVVQGIIIQEATDEDMLAVHRWLNPGANPTKMIRHDNTVTNWVATFHGQLAGFVQLVRHPANHTLFSGLWLFSLTVKTHLRGLGIGEMLSRATMDRAIREGASTLDLLVYENNVRAIRLYQKLGFEMYTIPELEPQLESERASTGRRRVVMRKNLELTHGR